MLNLTPTKTWLHSHADVMLDLVRLYLGCALFFKGVFFMSNHADLLKLIADSGPWWFAPAAIAHYVIPVHLVGGAMLALGLLTRVAALVQLPVLVGATFFVTLPKLSLWNLEPRENFELSALVLFLTCLVFLHGAGRFSVDALLEKESQRESESLPHAV
ncbi:MAG: DoxX family protein [Verrucomicrobia bacterium]|nr:DoxX family protein [Verrucomicrobiota bacterium]